MKRWLFNLAAGISLLMLLAAVALTVHSYWVCDMLQRTRYVDEPPASRFASRLEQHVLLAYDGRFAWARVTVWLPGRFPAQYQPPVEWTYNSNSPGAVRWRMSPGELGWGFGRSRSTRSVPQQEDFAFERAPGWFFALCFAIVPVIWLWRWRQHRQFGPGCCSKCGYDLRATPDRCPECGTAPAGAAR